MWFKLTLRKEYIYFVGMFALGFAAYKIDRLIDMNLQTFAVGAVFVLCTLALAELVGR